MEKITKIIVLISILHFGIHLGLADDSTKGGVILSIEDVEMNEEKIQQIQVKKKTALNERFGFNQYRADWQNRNGMMLFLDLLADKIKHMHKPKELPHFKLMLKGRFHYNTGHEYYVRSCGLRLELEDTRAGGKTYVQTMDMPCEFLNKLETLREMRIIGDGFYQLNRQMEEVEKAVLKLYWSAVANYEYYLKELKRNRKPRKIGRLDNYDENREAAGYAVGTAEQNVGVELI